MGAITAWSLLAKAGQRVVVLERRDVVGGAAITETPWGPEYKVTALSYVVSLMPPTILRELELERHGYKVHPQGPYFAPHPDGRHLQLADDPVLRHKEIAKFSAHDADAIEEWDAWLTRLADVLGPLLSRVPPKVGSKRPGDLLDLGQLGWRLRGVDVATAGDLTRLFTSSIADLVDDHFESPQLKGVLSVSGVIGTWAGPRSPGTGYVMVHHKVGDVRRQPARRLALGRHGAVTARCTRPPSASAPRCGGPGLADPGPHGRSTGRRAASVRSCGPRSWSHDAPEGDLPRPARTARAAGGLP